MHKHIKNKLTFITWKKNVTLFRIFDNLQSTSPPKNLLPVLPAYHKISRGPGFENTAVH